MGVQNAATMRASRNRIGACTRGSASWADLAVRVDRGRNLFVPPLVGAAIRPAIRPCVRGWGPGRTDDGRVVRDFELEPTAREV